MATIDSVKLPDNSTYDLTDNYSGYAKKVAGATTDDLAKLTATGDLADSGKKLSDLVLKADVKDVLNSTSTTDPLSANQGRVLNENVKAIVDVYGAKNLLAYPYLETTKTVNGVTFTDNGDGTVTVSAATYPYTVPSNTTFYFVNFFGNYYKAGTYIFNGSPIVSNDIYLNYVYHYNGIYVGNEDKGNSVEFTLPIDTNDVAIVIDIKANAVLTEAITFKPMLRDARITDPTFVPFAETNLQLTQKTSGVSNRNFIDNPWFTVNQRGQSSYTDGQYSADRWKVAARNYGGSGITVNSNGVTIAFANANEEYVSINQKYESAPWKGKTVTFSLMANGVIYSKTFNWENGGSGTLNISDSPKIQMLWSDTTPQITIISFADAVTFRASKLEPGTVSTLYLDVAPDPTTELLKCQRYFYKIRFNQSGDPLAIGQSLLDKVYISIPFPVEMRSNPTMSYAGTFSFYEGSTFHTVTNIQKIASTQRCELALETSDTITNGLPCVVVNSDANAYIDFSADL